MKLDGKYGLIKNRRLAEIRDEAAPAYARQIEAALKTLELAGIIDWGDTVDTEFFVIRLRDINAGPALKAYANYAGLGRDIEYSSEVHKLADRSGILHPNPKVPD